jgi:Lysyl oxidase
MFNKYSLGAAAAMAAMTLISGPSAPASQPWLLPDLRQGPVGCPGGHRGNPVKCTDWDVCMVTDATAPGGECVTSGRIEAVRLRFTSSEDNIGDGPLLFYAHRDSTETPTMEVRQVFQDKNDLSIPGTFDAAQRGTSTYTYYEPAASHEHWHLMGFERYQLKTPEGSTLLVDRKNGFCLGDRYDVRDAAGMQGKPEGEAVALSNYLRGNMCAHHQPSALDVRFGISVGKGDDYRHTVDFQWLDLTSVPSGVYDVVNTVNSDRTLIEKSYDNNASSISISLQWPGGATRAPKVITAPPEVRLLRSCPGQSSCASEDG